MKYTEKQSIFQLCAIYTTLKMYIEQVKQFLRPTEMLPSIKYIIFIIIIKQQQNHSNEFSSLINQ